MRDLFAGLDLEAVFFISFRVSPDIDELSFNNRTFDRNKTARGVL